MRPSYRAWLDEHLLIPGEVIDLPRGRAVELTIGKHQKTIAPDAVVEMLIGPYRVIIGRREPYQVVPE